MLRDALLASPTICGYNSQAGVIMSRRLLRKLEGGNMKKIILSAFLALSAAALFAQVTVISVSDFTMESDNSEYKYLGKGISRLVAGELRKSGKVKLVEREDLKKILEEQELSLSDLMDSSKQVQLGKMLSAQFVVMGEIIDMGRTSVLISVRMASVETGEVVWQEEKKETLAAYDYLGAYFAQSLLSQLGISAGQATIAKVEKREEKKPEAILKVSEGIDAYDRKDTVLAKKALEEAKAIDPVNEVAAEYLAKLTVNTTKFEIQCDPFYSYQNPAYLGSIKSDRLLLSASLNGLPELVGIILGTQQHYFIPYSDTYELRETDVRFNAGYSFPLGESWGIGTDVFLSIIRNDVEPISGSGPSAWTARFFLGGIISAGYKLSDAVSLGAGISIFRQSNTFPFFSPIAPAGYVVDNMAFGANIGVMYVPAENVAFDSRIGANSATVDILNQTTLVVERAAQMPVYNENTLTLTFDRRRLFIILKQTNDVAWDRPYYFGRLLPAMEFFFADWMSVRASVEGCMVFLTSSVDFGFGAMGGLTFRIIPWGLDIDLNLAYRQKPSRSIEGAIFNDVILFLDFSLNGAFMSRN
jgi:TolB-like protein